MNLQIVSAIVTKLTYKKCIVKIRGFLRNLIIDNSYQTYIRLRGNGPWKVGILQFL